ncbi:MAG: RNA 2',3'-cyclic phosphodiesterase [Gemmobacter sp.]
MIRAFLALALPPQVRSRLEVLQHLLPLSRAVDPDTFHLTLVFLGEVPDPVLVALDDDLQRLRLPPFDLTLSGVGLFGGGKPRAAWAGVAPSEPLTRLQAKLDHAARMAGALPDARRFRPHVTLGRFAPPDPEDRLRLERAVVAQAGFAAGPFVVDEVTLYRSHLTRSGSEYQVLATYPPRFDGQG